MAQQTMKQVSRSWTTRRDEKRRRMQLVQQWMEGPILPKAKIIEALETLVVSGDRIVLEGDNQKQADFLSRSLVKVDAKRLHDLHLIISSISRPEHLTLFELGIAKKGGFRFRWSPKPARLATVGGWQARDWRHPHVCRTVCAIAGGPGTKCGSRLCGPGGC